MKLIPALAALALVVPSTAGAAAPVRLFDHPKGGLHITADLHATSGCIDRDAFVFSFENPDGTRGVFTEITRYDRCADQVLLDHVGGSDTLTPAEVSIADDLGSASLATTVPMFDALDPNFAAVGPLTLGLSWTASGPQYNDNILYDNGHHDGITLINHDHETCRDATVSGTASDGSTDYVAGATTESRVCRQIAGSLFLFIEK